jgi:hypothetical protein
MEGHVAVGIQDEPVQETDGGRLRDGHRRFIGFNDESLIHNWNIVLFFPEKKGRLVRNRGWRLWGEFASLTGLVILASI